jgi:hypothetical protein
LGAAVRIKHMSRTELVSAFFVIECEDIRVQTMVLNAVAAVPIAGKNSSEVFEAALSRLTAMQQ